MGKEKTYIGLDIGASVVKLVDGVPRKRGTRSHAASLPAPDSGGRPRPDHAKDVLRHQDQGGELGDLGIQSSG